MSTEQQIRKRKSYQMFKELLKPIETGTTKDILGSIYTALDEGNCYGSKTNAGYARESLTLLEQDFKL